METRAVREWQRLANEILDASWEFMNCCSVNFDRGFIGELLTLSQLIRTYDRVLSDEGNGISYLGSSKKNIDIQLLLEGRDIRINCKGTTIHEGQRPKWVRQHARKFCSISLSSDGVYEIRPKEDYDPNFFYVYVDVKAWLNTHRPDFFVLSDEEVKRNFGADYARNWNGRPARRNDSDDMWVGCSSDPNAYSYDLSDYSDNTLSRFAGCIKEPGAGICQRT